MTRDHAFQHDAETQVRLRMILETTMRRVILDSDDESDCSSPLKLQERELQISGSHDSGGEKSAPRTKSTGSTGLRCHLNEI